ncbi:MAG: hypothetical protein COB61_008810 [Thiotrichales bacterium]|nr:hypothetical protein [Thiotrichales bacterium]
MALSRTAPKLVGPQPCWSCQITSRSMDFAAFIPRLEDNSQDLTLFVHALIGDNWKDHTKFAYWLGQEAELNLIFFKND